MKKLIAVAKGRKPGIYENWNLAKNEVVGFSGAVYKGFQSKEEAIEYMALYGLDEFGNQLALCSDQDELLKFESQISQTNSIQISREISMTHQSLIPHYCFYTDGSADNNIKSEQGGAGIVMTDSSQKHLLYKQSCLVIEDPYCTNNLAEISAVYQALFYLDNNGYLPGVLIHFYIDSTYVINHLIQRNVQPNQNNYEALVRLLKVITMLEAKGFSFEWIYIEAHSGNQWNELADQLANMARQHIL